MSWKQGCLIIINKIILILHIFEIFVLVLFKYLYFLLFRLYLYVCGDAKMMAKVRNY